MDSIEIYYDGLNIDKYKSDSNIKGFTTNCSIFSTSNEVSYKLFYDKISMYLNDRPFSLQIWEDEFEKAIKQIDIIRNISTKIYIKVPIINSNGLFNDDIINYAIQQKSSLNITSIYTMDQIERSYKLLENYNEPIIISIFAGPISDSGKSPVPYIQYAKDLFKNKNNIKILWAGCRELYTISRAQESGCDIITIPDAIIDRIHMLNKDLNNLAIERVKTFKNDANKKPIQLI
jgi:transaldolase